MQSLLSHRTIEQTLATLIESSILLIKVYSNLPKKEKKKKRGLYSFQFEYNRDRYCTSLQSDNKTVWPNSAGGVAYVRRLVENTMKLAAWTLRCVRGQLLKQILLYNNYTLQYGGGLPWQGPRQRSALLLLSFISSLWLSLDKKTTFSLGPLSKVWLFSLDFLTMAVLLVVPFRQKSCFGAFKDPNTSRSVKIWGLQKMGTMGNCLNCNAIAALPCFHIQQIKQNTSSTHLNLHEKQTNHQNLCFFSKELQLC